MTLQAATDDFLNGLKDFLGAKGWRDPADAPEAFREDRDRFTGEGAIVVLPNSTEEVAEVVRRCAEARVPLIPYSGATGLVGGQRSGEGYCCCSSIGSASALRDLLSGLQ